MPIKPPSFETIENLGKKAGQTVGQAAAAVGGDIAEQFGLKEVPAEKKDEIKKDDKKKIDYISGEIQKLRQKEQQKQVQIKQVEKQEKQQKVVETKKKRSILQEVIDRSKGSKEIAKSAG